MVIDFPTVFLACLVIIYAADECHFKGDIPVYSWTSEENFNQSEFYASDRTNNCTIASDRACFSKGVSNSLSFSVSEDQPISLCIEWLWVDHYPVDTGLTPNYTTVRNGTIQVSFKLDYLAFVVRNTVSLFLVVTGTTATNTSSSLCIPVNFTGEAVLHPNESLPEDQTVAEGTPADFVCVSRASRIGDVTFIVSLLVQTPEYYPNFTKCFSAFFSQSSKNLIELFALTNESCTGVEILNSTSGPDGALSHLLTVRWPNPSPSLSGAKVVCALESRSHPTTITQWVKTATLIVSPTTPSPSMTITVTPVVTDNNVRLAAISLLFLLVIMVTGGVALAFLLRRRYKLMASNADDNTEQNADLIRTDSVQSSHSTVVISTSIPLISVVQPDSLPPPYSELPQGASAAGVSPSQSRDSVDTGYSGEGNKVHEDDLFLPATSEVAVYVSYSDSQGDWVRETLLPLLDTFQPISVTDHEGHMIPGRVYSEERLRLLRSADKVVAVISPDYQSSEWCSYELQHVIQQSPGGAGHLIPILCNGCHSLPSIIANIHPLSLKDPNWKHNLKKAIRRQHR